MTEIQSKDAECEISNGPDSREKQITVPNLKGAIDEIIFLAKIF